MAVNFEKIKNDQTYEVDIEGKTYEVSGSMILSALCPECGGSGQVSVEGGEPDVCDLCGGMGMFDYSVAEITSSQ